MTSVVPWAASVISAWFRTVKSSASLDARSWASRRICLISSCAAVTSSGEKVLARIWAMNIRPERRLWTVV